MNMSLTTKYVPDPRAADGVEAPRPDVAQDVEQLYRELADMPSLEPCPAVNDAFTRLVSLVLTVPDDDAAALLHDPEVRAITPMLRALCAAGESMLEFRWAARIAAAQSPYTELGRFPYVGNYRRLTRMETGALASAVTSRTVSMAFVGAGPLPLSALLFAREMEAPVCLVDNDDAALEAAAKTAFALGVQVELREGDAARVDLSDHDVVVLAALAGLTVDDKRLVLDRLPRSMSPGSLLLARSAHGARTLLYPPIGPEALDGFDVLNVVHPVNDVLNSAVLARAAGQEW